MCMPLTVAQYIHSICTVGVPGLFKIIIISSFYNVAVKQWHMQPRLSQWWALTWLATYNNIKQHKTFSWLLTCAKHNCAWRKKIPFSPIWKCIIFVVHLSARSWMCCSFMARKKRKKKWKKKKVFWKHLWFSTCFWTGRGKSINSFLIQELLIFASCLIWLWICLGLFGKLSFS